MLTPNEIVKGLAGFSGREAYHRDSPLHGQLVITDGVKWLADNAECHWLLDLIASFQEDCRQDEMLADFQMWQVTVSKDQSVVVTCFRDTGDQAFSQYINFTDFPLPAMKLYVQRGAANGEQVMVLMLPGEY